MSSKHSIEFNNLKININISPDNTINILCSEINTNINLFSYNYNHNSTNSIVPFVTQDNSNKAYYLFEGAIFILKSE